MIFLIAENIWYLQLSTFSFKSQFICSILTKFELNPVSKEAFVWTLKLPFNRITGKTFK